MTYFSYHNKIQKLIKDGFLTSYYFDCNYANIGFALVLNIKNRNYPIREHKFEEYFALIGEYYTTKKVDDVYHTTFICN